MSKESAKPLTDSPFNVDQQTDLRPLRQALEAVGFSQSALAQTTRLWESGDQPDYSVMLRRTATSTDYNIIVRLFALGQCVPIEAAARALKPISLDQLVAIGLLHETDAGIRSQAMILPWEGLLVSRDFGPVVTGRPYAANHVLGLGPASLTLASLTVRRRDKRVLDLGTGSGIQALLAARHAAQVIGTDTNRRALNFAMLNARLNDISNLELREGSLYEPVQDCQFDLVVANPPYVISPECRYVYRDSGLPGDAISERVIREGPAYLRDGGYCTVLSNWHHQQEEDWAERPRAWVDSSGCDTWILRFKTEDTLTYASTWLRSTEGRDPNEYNRLLDEWIQYYRSMGIQFFSKGAVILRRRSGGTNWVRTETVPPDPPKGSCSAQIERIFAAQTFLQQLEDDRDLLEQPLALTRHHQLEHLLKAEGESWTLKTARLNQTQGFEFVVEVDILVSSVLAGCNGQQPLRKLFAEVASKFGMESEQITPAGLKVARRLMELGFLGLRGHMLSD